MHPVLLFYNLDNETGRKIKLLCLRFKIKIKMISPEQYHQPIGALFGMEGIEPVPGSCEGEGFSEEMLVFKGFDNGLLDLFLREYGKMRIPRVGLKAVLTEQNIHWDSIALHRELMQEEAAMHPSESDHHKK